MKPVFNRIAAFIAMLVVALLPLAGCGDSGSDPGAPITVVKPKNGSLYVYNRVGYDTNGLVNSSRTDTIIVVNTNATLGAFTGLTAMVNTDDGDTGYLRYEPNGDLAFLVPTGAGGVETLIYPFASRKRVQLDVDTLQHSGAGFSVTIDSVLYVGDQSMAVPAGGFTVSKVVQVRDIRWYSQAWEETARDRELQTYYFAPSIGFMVKWAFETDHLDKTGKSISRDMFSQTELLSYKLQ